MSRPLLCFLCAQPTEWAHSIHYVGPAGSVHYGCACPACYKWLERQARRTPGAVEPLAVLVARRRQELKDLAYLEEWAASEEALRVVGAC